MFSRGPILMIFAAMLIGSPIVAQMFEGDRHVGINLVGASKDACSNSGVDTIAGRLGCSNQKNTRNRKYMANGALFVRP